MLTGAGLQVHPAHPEWQPPLLRHVDDGGNDDASIVLEVESARAATITVDSIVDGSRADELLRARRIGDCAERRRRLAHAPLSVRPFQAHQLSNSDFGRGVRAA